jgi:thioredoxin-like negative regulator of GroEL
MMSMNSVESSGDLASAMASDRPLLVCFMADWCGDCHFLKPALPDLEAQFTENVDFIHLDIDRHASVAQEYDVTGIPSFILFYKGRELYRLVNERRKSKDEVRRFLVKGLSLVS